jgi:hypothetical protein
VGRDFNNTIIFLNFIETAFWGKTIEALRKIWKNDFFVTIKNRIR